MKKVLKNIFYFIKLIFVTIILAICLRVFFFASYKIPSYSMLPAITGGDYILVNKWILGPRIYKKLNFAPDEKIETKRLWGIRKVKRNDVLVFNFPYKGDWSNIVFDTNTYYVKRCVAIPGDTFYVDKGIYRVKNSSDTLGNYQNQIENWKRFNKENSSPVDESFPYDKRYDWTILDFGPLYVPGKGDQLLIDTLNIQLYKNLITYETDKEIELKNEFVYLGEDILTTYTFKNDYYFMTGDYVFDSRDSRYWGLVPEDHIVGKVSLIWQSRNPDNNEFRWDRFLKKIK